MASPGLKFPTLGLSLAMVALLGSIGSSLAAQTTSPSEPERPVPPLPEWTAGMQTLEVEEELFDQGMPYYLMRDQHAQVSLEINSPLSRLVATSSRAGGFLVGPFDADEVEADESPVIAGTIRLPAASLRTGTRQDRPLHSGMVLDVANHRDIAFVFDSAKVLERKAGATADSTAFNLELEGSLVFKGKALPLTVEAELVLMLSSDATFGLGIVGDVARLTGEFEVTVEQLGLQPRLASVLGDSASVRFFMLFSTPDPERPILPPTTPEAGPLHSKYQISLRDRDDPATAFEAGEQLLKAAWNDAAALLGFANDAALTPDLSQRFLSQAKRAAERVVVLGGEQPNPMAINVLARIAATTGDFEDAISLQTQAIEMATSGRAARAKSAMEGNLKLYEQMEAARTARERD